MAYIYKEKIVLAIFGKMYNDKDKSSKAVHSPQHMLKLLHSCQIEVRVGT